MGYPEPVGRADSYGAATTGVSFPKKEETIEDSIEVLGRLKSAGFSGEAVFDTAPVSRLYFLDGTCYYAERDGDLTLGQQLVASGAITGEELERGAVNLGQIEYLGRFFERSPESDRHLVELAIERQAAGVLVDVARAGVIAHTTTSSRHHGSGISKLLTETAPGLRPLLARAQVLARTGSPAEHDVGLRMARPGRTMEMPRPPVTREIAATPSGPPEALDPFVPPDEPNIQTHSANPPVPASEASPVAPVATAPVDGVPVAEVGVVTEVAEVVPVAEIAVADEPQSTLLGVQVQPLVPVRTVEWKSRDSQPRGDTLAKAIGSLQRSTDTAAPATAGLSTPTGEPRVTMTMPVVRTARVTSTIPLTRAAPVTLTLPIMRPHGDAPAPADAPVVVAPVVIAQEDVPAATGEAELVSVPTLPAETLPAATLPAATLSAATVPAATPQRPAADPESAQALELSDGEYADNVVLLIADTAPAAPRPLPADISTLVDIIVGGSGPPWGSDTASPAARPADPASAAGPTDAVLDPPATPTLPSVAGTASGTPSGAGSQGRPPRGALRRLINGLSK